MKVVAEGMKHNEKMVACRRVDVESIHAVAELQVAFDTGQVAGAVKHVLAIVAYNHPTFSLYHHLLVSTWYVIPSDDNNAGTGSHGDRGVGRRSEISVPEGGLVASWYVPITHPPTQRMSIERCKILNSILIGGWWTRPANWKANTTIAFAGIFAVAYGVFAVSADKEVRSFSLPARQLVTHEMLSPV